MKQGTKQKIMNTFKDLLGSHSIDKVTVKELCDRSFVDRHTFYYYFSDIFDVFKKIIFEELSEEIAHNKTFDTWETGFLNTMNYLKQNAKMILNIYASSYRQEANDYLSEMSNKLVGGVVVECIAKMKADIKAADRDFIINFYRHSFNGWMLDWVQKGMLEEPDDILRRLLLMVTDMSCAVALFDRNTNDTRMSLSGVR